MQTSPLVPNSRGVVPLMIKVRVWSSLLPHFPPFCHELTARVKRKLAPKNRKHQPQRRAPASPSAINDYDFRTPPPPPLGHLVPFVHRALKLTVFQVPPPVTSLKPVLSPSTFAVYELSIFTGEAWGLLSFLFSSGDFFYLRWIW